MNVKKKKKKMKQHCDKIEGDCRKCCYLDYCYSQKRDIHEDFLSEIITSLSKKSDNDTGIFAPVIRNRHNALSVGENNQRK